VTLTGASLGRLQGLRAEKRRLTGEKDSRTQAVAVSVNVPMAALSDHHHENETHSHGLHHRDKSVCESIVARFKPPTRTIHFSMTQKGTSLVYSFLSSQLPSVANVISYTTVFLVIHHELQDMHTNVLGLNEGMALQDGMECGGSISPLRNLKN